MPVYEYSCPECGTKFEKFVFSHSEKHRTKKCPNCNHDKAKRIISSPSAISGGKSMAPSPSSACGGGGKGFS